MKRVEDLDFRFFARPSRLAEKQELPRTYQLIPWGKRCFRFESDLISCVAEQETIREARERRWVKWSEVKWGERGFAISLRTSSSAISKEDLQRDRTEVEVSMDRCMSRKLEKTKGKWSIRVSIRAKHQAIKQAARTKDPTLIISIGYCTHPCSWSSRSGEVEIVEMQCPELCSFAAGSIVEVWDEDLKMLLSLLHSSLCDWMLSTLPKKTSLDAISNFEARRGKGWQVFWFC